MARKSRGRPWIVIDSETDPFVHGRMPEPFLWVAYDGSNSQVWWDDHEGFLNWLSTFEGIAYAHNGGKFDFHFLADWMSGSLVLINDRIASVRIGSCELRDSWCLCPTSLSSYQKNAIDYSWFEVGARQLHKQDIIRYCKSDCEYLWEILASFHGLHPGLPLTLPGAGIKALARIERISIPDGSEGFDDIFRPYYFGGRCEAIKPGVTDGPLYWYDINSAYPFGMTKEHWWGLSFEITDELPEGKNYFARISAISKGSLPYRQKGRLAYPRDTEARDYFASHWEIQAALDTGCLDILRVHEVYIPSETRNFSNFVNHYWSLKERAEAAQDEALRYVAKIVLNGTYGKLAQDPRKHVDWEFLAPDVDPCTYEFLLNVGGRWVGGKPTPTPRFYNVATAASITGFVRSYLWRSLCEVSEPVYCDTDCIISRSHPSNTGRHLGAWKAEGVVNQIHIAGRKLYSARMSEKTAKHPEGIRNASKGCRLSAREIVDIVEKDAIITWENPAPSLSIKHGARFVKRRIRKTA